MTGRFVDKVAVVTAAGSGIGAAAATCLAREGAVVMVADISSRRAESVTQVIERDGGQAMWRKMDASVAADIDNTIATVLDAHGRVDVMINNAGYAVPGLLHETTLENWQRTLDVTLSSVFLGLRAVIPVMRRQHGGAIVNTASISGLRADFGMGSYNAAKSGVINLTRTAALENATHGIRVNCVCPGGIDTRAPQLLAGQQAPRFRQSMAQAHPLGRMGQAQEVAEAILFLASDSAAFVTGENLVVDGGVTIQTGLPNMLQFAP